MCGTDVTGTFAAHAAFPSARLVAGRGRDGADRALGSVLEEAHVRARFDTVIVGSGDGYFASHVDKLRRAGLHTIVVARHRCIAGALRRAAHRVVELP